MTELRRALASLMVLASASLWAQAAPVEEEEAPEAIFDQKIGDVGVVLDAEGTWTSRLAAGWGEGISPQGVLPGLGYPGLEKGAVFTQVPDFTLTLRLLERYYLELAYKPDPKDRSFLVGYDGQPGELVQWVKVGNAAFGVPARAGQTLGDGRQGAPAAGAAFSLGSVDLEAVARYEDSTRETRSYLGYRDLSLSTVGMDEWTRLRFFRLPGAPLSGVRVLVADPEASSGFRNATDSEAAVDSSTGEIRLPETAQKRYLVTWSGASTPPTSPGPIPITAPVDASPVSGTWFVLAQPGSPSAFELRDHYPVAAGTAGAILLVDKASGLPVSGRTVTQAPSQDWFTVTGDFEQAPFYSKTPGIYPGVTGAPPPAAAVLPWRFQLPGAEASSYELGSDVIASSLIVIRNGLATSAWKFDAVTGRLTFNGPIFDTDEVEISFQRRQTEGKASDLVLWQGGHWDLGAQAVEWNLLGRWNMDDQSYTTEDLQSPGRMAASVSWGGTAGEWSWSVAATGGALLADSTGHRRLFGESQGGAEASLDGNALRPSAAPGDSLGGTPLTQTNRLQAWYRNYWSNDPLTGEAVVSSWDKPGVGRESAGLGGATGPYLVRGDGQKSSRLAVLEVDQETAGWAGMQVFFDEGKPRDLKSTSAITLNLRVPEGLDGAKVYLQAGTLSENFDGTHAVRAVEYRSVPVLAFFDENQGKEYFPIPENSKWGNDGSSDGTAGEDADLVSHELPLDTGSTSWQKVRLVLTDTERQVLQRTTGWRLVLVEDGTGSGKHTLLAGPVVFEGATWSVKPNLLATGSVNPVEEASQQKDGNQLRVDWDTSRTSWSLESRVSPIRPASYRALAFRYKLVSGSGTITLKLTDVDGRGVKATWTLPAAPSSWVDGIISLRDPSLTLDGVPTEGVSLKPGASAWDRMTLSWSGGTGGGELLLDVVEAVDPAWEPMGTSTATASWNQTAAWPSSELPLVTGVAWSLTSAQSGLTDTDWSWQGDTTVSGSVGIVRAAGEASLRRSVEGQEAHGAYQATLPLAWSGGPSLEWTDQFSDRGLRSEHLVLGVPWVGTWDATAKASGPPTVLDQEYRLGWTSSGQWPRGWGASAAGTANLSQPWTGELGDFGSQWTESWGWLEPPEQPTPYSSLRFLGSTKAGWQSWSLETDGRAQVTQSGVVPAVKWSPAGSWELRTPYRAEGEQAWSITPSVGKRTELVLEKQTALLPEDSAGAAAELLATQAEGLVAFPFAEQLSSSSPWSGETPESGLVESSTGVEWERSPASDWSDLVVPGSGGSKYLTVRGIEGTGEYRSASVSSHLQARGINLFGTLGSTPVFTWYRSDVWTWAATGTWSDGTRVKDRATDASLTARSDLVLTVEEAVGLPVTYQGTWSQTPSQSVGIKPTWTLRRPADLPFVLPGWLSPRAFHREWVQELSSSLDLGWQPTPAPVVRDLQVSWKGRFLLSDKSELSLTTRWGQQWQENLTVVGLEASLDLVLSF